MQIVALAMAPAAVMPIGASHLGERSAVVSPSPTPGQQPPSEDGTSSRWGRHGGSTWATSAMALAMMLFSPMVVWFALWSCAENDCSILRSSQLLLDNFLHKAPATYTAMWNPLLVINSDAVMLWTTWLALQFILYSYVPGPRDHGQPTPAGYTLKYVVNGWNCWWICHVNIFVVFYYLTGFEAALLVSRNWLPLFFIANTAGFALAAIAYVKACVAPSHANDLKFSGSFFYDLFMGVEHNPRLSSHPYSFDFKIFFNGRPGILAWTLINIIFAITQFYRFGAVSNSMLILNFLQAIYVLDFFWNEGWYLRTIDICHEHFGFYLSWGDLCWLPFMYTLQGLFLSTHFVQLSTSGCIGVLTLGCGGYALFRRVNAEKDRFRKEMRRLDQAANGGRDQDGVNGNGKRSEELGQTHKGAVSQHKGQAVLELPDYKFWGQPTRYLAAQYYTGHKNEIRQSYLLLSGFWGLSRHMNYLGDLMLSLAFCLTCGFTHALPYFYIVFMLILLLHRVARDDEKCRQKYGKVWTKYCEIVRYKIVPFVY